MQNSIRYKKLRRISNYATVINLEGVYEIDFSQSKTSILVHLFKDNDNIIDRSIVDFHKMEDDVFAEKIDEICEELDRYRNY